MSSIFQNVENVVTVICNNNNEPGFELFNTTMLMDSKLHCLNGSGMQYFHNLEAVVAVIVQKYEMTNPPQSCKTFNEKDIELSQCGEVLT